MKNQFRQMASLFILIIVDEISLWVLLPILATLVAQHSPNLLGADNPANRHFWFAIIMAISPLCSIIGAPIWGFISDHIGRKKVLTISLCGTLCGFLLYSASFTYQNLLLLIVGRFVVGITTASQPIVQAVMADISEGKQKAVNMALIACAMTLPLVFAPLIGGYLSDSSMVSWFTYATPFKFISVLAFINLIMLYFFFQEPTREVSAHNITWKNLRLTLSVFAKQKTLRQLFTCFILMELAWTLYFQSMPLLLAEKFHFTSVQLGNFSAELSLWMALALLFLMRIFVRFFSLNKIIFVTIFAAASGLLCSFIYPQIHLLWIFAMPISIGVGISYVALVTKLSDAADKKIQGTLMGMVDSFLALAYMVTSLLAGWLSYLNAMLPLIIAAAFMLVALGYSKLVLRDNMSFNLNYS